MEAWHARIAAAACTLLPRVRGLATSRRPNSLGTSHPVAIEQKWFAARSRNPVLCEGAAPPDRNGSYWPNFRNDDRHPVDGAACYQEQNEFSNLQIYAAGNGDMTLANEISSHLGITLGRVHAGRFADGEVKLKVLDEVRGRDTFVVYSAPPSASCAPSAAIDIHSSVLEFFLLISALRRSSAGRITAVIPYMSYFRQSEVFPAYDRVLPLPAADMAQMMKVLGVDRVIFVDVHSERAEAFFGDIMPVSNIQPLAMVIQYFKRKGLKNPVVVSCDNSGGERAKAFWTQLQQAQIVGGLATLVTDKPWRVLQEDGAEDPTATTRSLSEPAENTFNSPCDVDDYDGSTRFVGEVEGCDCIIVDDIIDTAERVERTAKALKSRGAARIYVYATHGLFSAGSFERINKSDVEEVVVTNSVGGVPKSVASEKIRVLSIGKLLGEAVHRVHHNIGVSSLYRDASFDDTILKRNQSVER